MPGFYGPDPQLVSVAERYARANGINLKRQAEYVQVDPERAKRIADAYEAMPHAPNDPRVKEAFQNLIRQTKAQYDALVNAGYKFWFIDLDREDNLKYISSPWNAMRDIRANKSMGIFPTEAGFGSGDAVSENPLEATVMDFTWPSGDLNGPPRRVVANDLFRAVHDAFGHGLEGSGFRAQGEENAWQAHVRLFTGSAVGAITSETRGQNSWLNYGPNGKANQTAKVEDTVFADQKTGLMPSWTWEEGVVGDMPEDVRLSARAPGELFYSELKRQIDGASMKQAAPGAWKQFIKALSGKGVKADEIEWTGVTEWLDLQEGKVTRQQISDYLSANGVQVQEVVLGKMEPVTDRQKLNVAYERAIDAADAAGGSTNPSYIERQPPENRTPEEQTVLDAWNAVNENPEESWAPEGVPSKYGQYTLPGGQNYREVLLKLPGKQAPLKSYSPEVERIVREQEELIRSLPAEAIPPVAARYAETFGVDRGELLSAIYDITNSATRGGEYQSTHWDQTNILAHIRLNDRTDTQGRKVLFVEEIQSDWGQDTKRQRDEIAKAVEDDFQGIVARMKKAGLLQVDCD